LSKAIQNDKPNKLTPPALPREDATGGLNVGFVVVVVDDVEANIGSVPRSMVMLTPLEGL
jgi:hypothetical protein